MKAVAKRADVKQDRGLEIELDGETLVLVRDGDSIRAFEGKCPHAGAPLAKGAVCDGRIVCPWHKAMFSVSDGSLMEPPALAGLARYEVRVEGDDVMVGAKQERAADAAEDDGRVALIVGAGAAGAAGAAGLREFGFGGQIVLIGRENAAPYDRTALSKFVMEGAKAPDEVSSLLPPGFFAEQRVDWRQGEVTSLDPASRKATLADGSEIAFDMALVTTGAAPKRPEIPGVELGGVHVLRTKADAKAIVSGLDEGEHAVILGSSFIGLEVAAGLRKRGVAVAVVTPETIPFAKQMGERIGSMFKALHEQNGVTFHTGAEVAKLAGGDAVERVELKDGSSLPAKLVVVGIGVAPETKFVKGVSREKDGGITVDASMRAAERVFVAGDAARFPYRGEIAKIEHWRVAQQTARIAARAMAGSDTSYDAVPYFWTYHFGKRFDYLGHPQGWDDEEVEGDLDGQDFMALLLKSGEVVGAIACGRERLAATLITRMRSGLSLTEARALIQAG